MFLITTANQYFWKIDNPILFLGEWCKLFSQRTAWQKLNYEVLPYHWDDRKRLYHDYLYLKEVYEQYLQFLGNRLNDLHGEKHSLRYWRIIIGPWLQCFIAILFDRYVALKQASEAYEITNTWIADVNFRKWVPQDMSGFNSYFSEDDYNHFLYSKIIKHLKLMPYETIDWAATPHRGSKSVVAIKTFSFKGTARSVIMKMLSRFSKIRNPSFFFIESYFSSYEQAKLEMALGQLPTFFSEINLQAIEVNPKLRCKLFMKGASGEFESLLEKFIPEQMPTAHIENYKKIQEMAYFHYPKKTKVIFTAVACFSNEVFKCWAAKQVEQGAKFVIGQHGGHYGAGSWDWIEEHQIKISDQFITWGWTTKDEQKVQPLPAGKLTSIKKDLRPNSQGHILWVWCGLPRYSYRLYSVPMASQFSNYIEDQINFAKKLSYDASRLLLLRFYPKDYGWAETDKMRELNLGTQGYYGEQSINNQLKQSRLLVGTYNATTYLESFASNFPTIIFWDPDYWELRPSAQPFFDKLRAAKILHDTPESAAEKVNEIYRDPMKWWKTVEVQDAKNRFCEQFAKSSPNWVNEWKMNLLKIAKTVTH